MSGKRYTQILLEAELQRKLDLVETQRLARRRTASLGQEMEALLGSASQGKQETFEREVKACRAWLGNAMKSAPAVTTADAEPDLQLVANESKAQAAEGEKLFCKLSAAFTTKAEEMDGETGDLLAEIQTLMVLNRGDCEEWFRERVAHWEPAFETAKELATRENYTRARELLTELESDVRTCAKEACKVAGLQVKRLTVLEALRASLRRLGYGEVAEPAYDTRGDRLSPIRLDVSSVARGNMSFFLSLDENASSFRRGEGGCDEDLSELSKILEGYDVRTEFLAEDGEQPPEGISRRAMKLPDEAEANAEALRKRTAG